MTLRLAVAQFKIAHLERETNLSRIENFIREAVQQHAQVIVFPEDCITGSIFGEQSRLESDGSTRKVFQNLARTYTIDIVTGSIMEKTPEGNFNTSYYIDSSGQVLDQYRKNHLHPSEYSFLQHGTEAPVFQTAYGKAGIVICWDMLFSEIFLRLKKEGVQLIYCPSYWYQEISEPMTKYNPHAEEEQIDALCLTRALETNTALVYANAAGEQNYANSTKDTLIGHSQIVMPVLGSLQRLEHNDEQMIVQEIDLDLLEASKHIYQA